MIRFANYLLDEKQIVACVLDPDGNRKITVYFNGGAKLDIEGTLADRVWDYLNGYQAEADTDADSLVFAKI